MSVIDQIKLANAGRRMFAQMCNPCRQKITKTFADDYRTQQLTGRVNQNPQDIKDKTMALLCENCKKVYEEAINNR